MNERKKIEMRSGKDGWRIDEWDEEWKRWVEER